MQLVPPLGTDFLAGRSVTQRPQAHGPDPGCHAWFELSLDKREKEKKKKSLYKIPGRNAAEEQSS